MTNGAVRTHVACREQCQRNAQQNADPIRLSIRVGLKGSIRGLLDNAVTALWQGRDVFVMDSGMMWKMSGA